MSNFLKGTENEQEEENKESGPEIEE